MIQQQSASGQMSLRSRHHQSCSTLWVDRVHVHSVLQQQLHHLTQDGDKKEFTKVRLQLKRLKLFRCSLSIVPARGHVSLH